MKMDKYSTHQALLVAALSTTDGDIFEIGGGWYSTPLISAHANMQRRLAFTVETGSFVYNILRRFNCDFHKVRLMHGYNFDRVGKFARDVNISKAAYIEMQREFLDELWLEYQKRRRAIGGPAKVSVAFVDQAPGFLRTPAIEFFADKAEFVIAHDTEHSEHYEFEPTLSSFKSRWDFNLHKPNSVIVSNTRDCSIFAFLSDAAAAPRLPAPSKTPLAPIMRRRLASLLPPPARRRVASLLRRLRLLPAADRR
jgi:hypothetical protein